MLILVTALVIITEMLNTAIERVTNMVTIEYNPLAKTIKDVAAGAVLVSAIGAALCGIILYARFDVINRIVQDLAANPLKILLFAALIAIMYAFIALVKYDNAKAEEHKYHGI